MFRNRGKPKMISKERRNEMNTNKYWKRKMRIFVQKKRRRRKKTE